MPTLPGMNGDVYFGDTEKPLPNWRADVSDVSDDDDSDDPTPEEKAAVIGMLGFDPAELWPEESDSSSTS